MEEEAPPPAALAGRQRQGRRQNVFVQAVTLEVFECISCLETCVYVCQCWFRLCVRWYTSLVLVLLRTGHLSLHSLCAMVCESVLSFVALRTSEFARVHTHAMQDDWVAPTYPKDDAEKAKLGAYLSNTALLAYLDPKSKVKI